MAKKIAIKIFNRFLGFNTKKKLTINLPTVHTFSNGYFERPQFIKLAIGWLIIQNTTICHRRLQKRHQKNLMDYIKTTRTPWIIRTLFILNTRGCQGCLGSLKSPRQYSDFSRRNRGPNMVSPSTCPKRTQRRRLGDIVIPAIPLFS